MSWNPKAFSYFSIFLCLAWGLSAFAAQEIPQTWTLDGKLYQTGNSNPLLDNAAKVTIQIIDPSGACLLYEEQQTIDTKTTSGYFSIHVGSATGSAKRTVNDPGRSMVQIFQNQTGISANSVPGQTCAGGAYSPALGAVRYFRLIVTPSATNVADTLTPDIVIDSVPNAMVAQSVQGLERANILQTSVSASTALTQANLDALFTTPAYTNLQSILGGNFIKTDSSGASLPSYASDPAGVSNGDIWFDTTTNEIKFKNAAGVQTVGASGGGGGISSLTVGSSMSINGTVAGTISSSGTIDLSNTGVSAGTYTKVTVDTKGRVTAGTVSLVEADIPNLTVAGKVSGNTITFGTISGSAGVNTSGNLISTGTVSGLTVQATNLRVYNGTNYVQFVAPTLAGIVNFTLPDNDGNPGDVLTSNGSGVLSWAAGTTTLAGDVSGPSGTTSVDKIKGKAVTAASVSGQIMIYDGTAWTNNVMSGDATLAHNGIFTLNKVPVTKGGTNSTTFGNNRIIASNGTGSALVDFTCPLNQVITFDASGNSTCANVSSLITALVNGGNTTGADISAGTNDNKALKFKTNNSIAMTISQNGYVGIGTQSPSAVLDVVANYTAGRFETTQNGSNAPAIFIATGAGGGFGSIPYVQLHNSIGSNNSGMGLIFSGKDNHPAVAHVAGIEGRMTNTTSNNHSGILIFGTASSGTVSERMRISETGNVGLGLQNPTSALDISGAFTAQGMSSAPSVSATNTGRIYYDYSTNKFKVSQNGGAYVDLANNTGFTNGGNAFGANAVLGTTDTRPLSFITSNSTAMSISQSGYVGIGTTNPSEKLEVNGGIKLGLTTGTGAGTIRWDGANFQGYDGTAWSNFTLPAPPAGACDTTVTFSIAGTYNYTVPASFGTITIQLWGAGGGGAGAGTSGPVANGSAGGTTSIAALSLTAQGGSGGLGNGTGGAGGTGSGGTTNTTGSSGANGGSGQGGLGGTAPSGGAGGTGAINNAGNNGAAPGGGGGGGGYSYSGGGGGSGAYVSKTFSSATLSPGTALTGIVVGGGGMPSGGYSGRDGGYGGIGRVTITCASAGAAPVNDRGIVFWDSGTHASSTTFVHDASGNVGVGTATPTAKLDVVGQARTTASGGAAKVNTSAAVDWNNGNAQSMSVACTTTTFTNMLDGGTYILAVSETGTTTCTFSQAGLTFFYNPANGARTSGQRTVYTFQRIGTDVYVSWIPGFQ